MPYADSDFFLALLKPEDWLKVPAKNLLKQYKGRIWTSQLAVIEIFMIAKRLDLDVENIASAIFELSDVRGISKDVVLGAAHLIKKEGVSVFDAFHSMTCGEDSIISSDSVFDKIGIKRIPLER